MRNRIILNLAISVDGFIADEQDGYEWIAAAAGDSRLNSANVWSHDKFLEGVSAIVMGKRCYDLNFHEGYKTKQVYVATSEKIAAKENVSFISGDICGKVLELKEKCDGDIYLFGSGILINQFLKAKIIDEYIIGIIPVILGKGIPLFLNDNPSIPLELTHYYVEKGVMILRYIVKGSSS